MTNFYYCAIIFNDSSSIIFAVVFQLLFFRFLLNYNKFIKLVLITF